MTQQTLPDEHYTGTQRERIDYAIKATIGAIQYGIMSLMLSSLGQIIRWWFIRKQKKNEIVWLDSLTFGKRNTDAHIAPLEKAADFTPNTDIPTRVSRVMKHDSYPEPDYPFAWKQPPISGDIVNGLGETSYRRAKKNFHTADYTSPWGGLEFYFHMIYRLSTNVRTFRLIFWESRLKQGAVNPVQQPVDNPHEMSEIVKNTARELGAVMVGITELKDHHVFDEYDLPYKYAISVVLPMDREVMLTIPSAEASHEITEIYSAVGQIANHLSMRIRAIGHEAKAVSGIDAASAEVLHIPIALDAGLGQLGKHGSMITKEYGSNVRLATVLTNLPLAIDKPIDIGVDDFCSSCRICTTNCPPHAIFDTKQMVRGEEKWYVNFDTCVPYFSSHGGCGICIEVCPWSADGRGPIISKKMLERREKDSRST